MLLGRVIGTVVPSMLVDELSAANTDDEHALADGLNRAVWRALRIVAELGGALARYGDGGQARKSSRRAPKTAAPPPAVR